ncbi:MAG: 4Fe-4S dicluster domain-containing protein, partial [Candidatus Poribacteria bacterium]|nr:4Fe-4S dicluster domain-containing protein [Candidatus Poribacteria bacterium]MDE0084268.1 4Fe-4S dicluster domain-containing protein [Candidatus Poribacteria bacterium]
EELCSGCDFCVHICPWECLELKDPDTGEHAESFFGICELVKPKDCVGCKLCEEVCIKDAIRIESPVLVELDEAAD